MDQNVIEELNREDPSDFHAQMLKDSRALVDMSRRKMSQYYSMWDHNMDVFKGIIAPDKEDKAARDRKEPERMVVPIAYSQIMTFVAFCFALYTQRERVFELTGMSEEDHKPAKIGEAFIARDLAYNIFEEKLFQFLLDIARCSMGIWKCGWVHEKQWMDVTTIEPVISLFGLNFGTTKKTTRKEVTKYLGNKLAIVSPYRFFPDTRLPISRFQEGEFVASEDDYSYVALKQLEHLGTVAGVDMVKKMTPEASNNRGLNATSDFIVEQSSMQAGDGQSKQPFIVTEVERLLIPSKYMVNGKPLGKEDYPVKYLVWYANDNRVIRIEPLKYIHDQFTYTVSQLTPDQHQLVNLSLSDIIDSLQSVISWFINSHITAVRKTIQNWIVVDPNGVEMKDLQDRRSVIRLKASAPGGIDRVLKQLAVTDVTSNHIGDVDMLQKLVQITTGISENLMGQFHPGRRSATEARNVNSGAINRLKMQATVIYKTGLEPLARQMLSNLRDGLDESTMVRLVGIEPTAQSGPLFAKANKEDLAGNYDFEIFDGTLPSERMLTAQSLQEVLGALISNPQAALALQIDPKAMLLEALELKGVRNPERFTLVVRPEVINNANGQPGQVGAAPEANGVQSPENESLLSLFGQSASRGGGPIGEGSASSTG